MWVAELSCPLGHGFEGWFGSKQDFDLQRERGLVTCPQCGSAQVDRKLSAPRLNFGATETPPVAEKKQPVSLPELLAVLRAGSEDMGSAFAQEARRIHEGEAPERAIRGQATQEELVALIEDDIPVLPLPSLDSLGSTH
jgi:hypothetical protein